MSDLHRTELRLERNRKCYLDKKANAICSNQASYLLALCWSYVEDPGHFMVKHYLCITCATEQLSQESKRAPLLMLHPDFTRLSKTQNSEFNSLLSFAEFALFFLLTYVQHILPIWKDQSRSYSNRKKYVICCGFFFHLQINTDLLHQDGVCGTDLTLTTVPVFTVIKEVVNLFHSVAHWCVFTIELYGTEE